MDLSSTSSSASHSSVPVIPPHMLMMLVQQQQQLQPATTAFGQPVSQPQPQPQPQPMDVSPFGNMVDPALFLSLMATFPNQQLLQAAPALGLGNPNPFSVNPVDALAAALYHQQLVFAQQQQQLLQASVGLVEAQQNPVPVIQGADVNAITSGFGGFGIVGAGHGGIPDTMMLDSLTPQPTPNPSSIPSTPTTPMSYLSHTPLHIPTSSSSPYLHPPHPHPYRRMDSVSSSCSTPTPTSSTSSGAFSTAHHPNPPAPAQTNAAPASILPESWLEAIGSLFDFSGAAGAGDGVRPEFPPRGGSVGGVDAEALRIYLGQQQQQQQQQPVMGHTFVASASPVGGCGMTAMPPGQSFNDVLLAMQGMAPPVDGVLSGAVVGSSSSSDMFLETDPRPTGAVISRRTTSLKAAPALNPAAQGGGGGGGDASPSFMTNPSASSAGRGDDDDDDGDDDDDDDTGDSGRLSLSLGKHDPSVPVAYAAPTWPTHAIDVVVLDAVVAFDELSV
ncbi:hypothetical protein HDU67_008240 [Dinochytrium kinnereticum]|nr:hypothetical protein HDU67_008240 [Dinochytrium kinnereticum]